MKALEGMRFKRTSSPMHRLDPRVKFVVSCAVFLLGIMFTELLPLIVLLTSQLFLVYFARVHKEWLQSLRGSLVLVAVIFLTNLIVGYASAGFRLTSNVLTYSVSMALRFVTLVASFSVFFLTTSPDDLGLALERSHFPYEFSFAFTTAVRFVPVLADEAQTIIDAQRSRGLEVEKGSFVKRIRNYLPILIPLIVNAIRRSLELAEAMESRAFGAKKHRTNLFVLKIKAADYVALAVVLVVLAVSIYIRLYVNIPVIAIPTF